MAYRAVFHMNDESPAKHLAVCRNIQNLLAEMPDAEVELVVQGDALPMVLQKETTVADQVARLRQKGVTVAVCRNTLRAKNANPEDLLPDLVVVPSAVGELVRRQGEGMAYIKP